MNEGIAIGNRVIDPEQFSDLLSAVNNGVEVLYACHSLPLETNQRALISGSRHGLLELREVLHEAWEAFQEQGESLTRGARR